MEGFVGHLVQHSDFLDVYVAATLEESALESPTARLSPAAQRFSVSRESSHIWSG